MKNFFIIIFISFILIGCEKQKTLADRIDTNKLIYTLVNDIAEEGINLFAMQKHLFGKQNFTVLLYPKFEDENNFYFDSTADKQIATNEENKEELLNLKMRDILKINFSNVKLIEFPEFDSLRRKNMLIKPVLGDILLKHKATAILVFSRPILVDECSNCRNEFDILVNITCTGNASYFVYRLELDDKENLKIKSRKNFNEYIVY